MRYAQIQLGERVYDLGAGTGLITSALVAAGAHALAVERDANLMRKLRARFAAAPAVAVPKVAVPKVAVPKVAVLEAGDWLALFRFALAHAPPAKQRRVGIARPIASKLDFSARPRAPSRRRRRAD